MSNFHKNRKESSIFNIRTFHNWVKRELIKESVEYLHDIYAKQNIKLLDLAVGRGGDMRKWYDSGIFYVVGFDIDKESIDEANERYQSLCKELRKLGKKIPSYKFYVKDLSDRQNLQSIKEIIGNDKFDMVSCQFAIHYFFKSKDTLDTFIEILDMSINLNGMFIATTMDGDKIKQIFKSNKTVIENDIFKIENLTTDLDKSFNNKFVVNLGKKTDKGHYFVDKPSEEYLIDLEELKNLCKDKNIMFIGQITFQEWYESYPKKNLSNIDTEWSFLNISFMFTKK
jgi:mRNA (guanine-N7-)-methyltransferase